MQLRAVKMGSMLKKQFTGGVIPHVLTIPLLLGILTPTSWRSEWRNGEVALPKAGWELAEPVCKPTSPDPGLLGWVLLFLWFLSNRNDRISNTRLLMFSGGSSPGVQAWSGICRLQAAPRHKSHQAASDEFRDTGGCQDRTQTFKSGSLSTDR